MQLFADQTIPKRFISEHSEVVAAIDLLASLLQSEKGGGGSWYTVRINFFFGLGDFHLFLPGGGFFGRRNLQVHFEIFQVIFYHFFKSRSE